MGRAEEEQVGKKPWKGPIPAPMKGWMDAWMYGCMDGWADGLVGHGCVSGGGRVNQGCLGICTDGTIDAWVD